MQEFEFGKILLAFDSDAAGQQAALDAIDKHYSEIFSDDEERIGWNSNWVKDSEAYDEFLDTILRVGAGTYLGRNDKIGGHQIRGWSVNRLVYILTTFQKIIAKCLYFGQAYNIAYVLPLCQKIESELITELKRRATPKSQMHSGARNQSEFLKAEDVLQRVDKQRVYAFYLPDLKVKGQEMWAKCPFHKGGRENRASFSANISTGMFRCKTCGTGSSIFEFIKLVEKCDYNTAINRANELGS
jgi:hypothetical protein